MAEVGALLLLLLALRDDFHLLARRHHDVLTFGVLHEHLVHGLESMLLGLLHCHQLFLCHVLAYNLISQFLAARQEGVNAIGVGEVLERLIEAVHQALLLLAREFIVVIMHLSC